VGSCPLHPRQRHQVFIAVGQIRLAQHYFAGLLTGCDDQGMLRLYAAARLPIALPHPHNGVHVDRGGPAGGLHKPVGHRQYRRLLQSQDIGEVVGKVLQKRSLSRPRIAEHRRRGGEPALSPRSARPPPAVDVVRDYVKTRSLCKMTTSKSHMRRILAATGCVADLKRNPAHSPRNGPDETGDTTDAHRHDRRARHRRRSRHRTPWSTRRGSVAQPP